VSAEVPEHEKAELGYVTYNFPEDPTQEAERQMTSQMYNYTWR
jgi:hypothetical protein